MPRKIPFRPDTEITQTYPDGFADFYRVEDTAEPGYQPRPEPELMEHLHYAAQGLGLNRLYLARQNHTEIQKLLRVPKRPLDPQYVVRDHDGKWYDIESVQDARGIYPPSLDVALKATIREVAELEKLV